MGCISSSSASDEPKSEILELSSTSNPSDAFVTAKGGDLYLNGNLFRFASLNAPELLDGEVNQAFEVKDTFDSLASGFHAAVTRTYTLTVTSINRSRSSAHIKNWNSEWNDWEFDEGRLVEMDFVLSEAARLNVKLIIPIINQDYGGEDTNFVGNFRDLIRMRKGISYEDAKKVDWWTDEEMINSMKLIIDKVLNRTNTFNGRRYGNDPTVLCWETGNEMNYLGYRAAPASWTITIAKHLKHLAPQTLVMDGSFSRTETLSSCFNEEVLKSEFVDIMSYHYYGSGDIDRVKKDIAYVRKAGKVYIAGEYGFFDRGEDYARFLSIVDLAGGAGSLAWSLRPHSSRGGFKTHSEGNGIYSYHIPGWNPSPHPHFSPSESVIINAIRSASYKILKVRTPPFPVPLPPARLWYDHSCNKVCYTGVPWASKYIMDISGEGQRELFDFVGEGENGVVLQGGTGRRVRIRAVGVDGGVSSWSEELVI